MPDALPPFAIFRPGTFKSMEGTEVTMTAYQLGRAAEVYNARQDRAPIVIDHPKDDRPIYGTVGSASFADGHLWAHPSDVAPSLQQGVRAGRYKGVSARFMPPDHPRNPSPGTYHIQHVGILERMKPAVKGMPDVSFAESGCADLSLALSFASPVVEPLMARARRLQADHPGMCYSTACDILQLEERASAAEMSFGEGEDGARRRVQWERVRSRIDETKSRFPRR